MSIFTSDRIYIKRLTDEEELLSLTESKTYEVDWRKYSSNLEVAGMQLLCESDSAIYNLEKDLIHIETDMLVKKVSYLDESIKETLISWWEKFIEMLKAGWRKISEWWNKFLDLFRKKAKKAKAESKPANEYSKEKIDCSANLDYNSFQHIGNYDLEDYASEFGRGETASHFKDFSFNNIDAELKGKGAEHTLKAKELLEKDEIFKPNIMGANLEKKFYTNSKNIKFSKADANYIVQNSEAILTRLDNRKKSVDKWYKTLIENAEKRLRGEKSEGINFGEESSKADILLANKMCEVDKALMIRLSNIATRIFNFAQSFRN